MDVLPTFIEVLDLNARPYEPRRRLRRLDAAGRSEAEWDRIITENVELLADALREAELIAVDSTLMCLGAQIDSIDLVFAEVSADDTHELRRLVLLEDKLLRNPEATRQVLAQILDYALRVQEDWPRGNFAEKFPGKEQWASDNRDELGRTCRRGDFLLIIAGDGISDGLAKLAKRFAGKDDPLTLTELALVSMPLYGQGTDLLLVPHVVSAVQRSEREVTVRVIVQSLDGREVSADVSQDTEPAHRNGTRALPVREEVAAFLIAAREPLDRELLPQFGGMIRTSQPRKSLEYWPRLGEGKSAVFKIHFGGYSKDAWSPIYVGLVVGTPTTPERDAWLERMSDSAAKLPPGTIVADGGPRTACALVPFDWARGEELDDALAHRLADTLVRFASVLGPMLAIEPT